MGQKYNFPGSCLFFPGTKYRDKISRESQATLLDSLYLQTLTFTHSPFCKQHFRGLWSLSWPYPAGMDFVTKRYFTFGNHKRQSLALIHKTTREYLDLQNQFPSKSLQNNFPSTPTLPHIYKKQTQNTHWKVSSNSLSLSLLMSDGWMFSTSFL